MLFDFEVRSIIAGKLDIGAVVARNVCAKLRKGKRIHAIIVVVVVDDDGAYALLSAEGEVTSGALVS